MKNSGFALPLLPDSIAVGLNEDLLQYLVELKFLLLFFKQPHCIFSNAGLQFLTEEAVDDLKRHKKTKTSVWGDEDPGSDLKNLNVLLTDEWKETISYCIPYYRELNLEISDQKNEFDTDHIVKESGLVDFDADQWREPDTNDKQGFDEEAFESHLAQLMIRVNMQVMIDVLTMCCNERIPMIWGDPADTAVASVFSQYLLRKYSDTTNESESEETAAQLRTIKGDDLLRSIFSLQIINLATVSVSEIVTFRNKNQDLLNSFLVSYRGFLSELEVDPLNYRKLAKNRTQKIVDELNTINMELLALRRTEKFHWVERLSEGVYEGAKNGAIVAIWNLLASPMLLAGQIGMGLLSAANFRVKDIKDRHQQEQALVFKSSSGYLWKAMQDLKK